ncbi:unnamed protein product [Pleuronectes platessa]|uniref:Uncharacterized protein n=1 Tax=Pleuronectes platessa TaxID=8262 RepID=A0A9N7YJK1_PLEPL|nr:unnamed protein product [Pleuronectes platessa]
MKTLISESSNSSSQRLKCPQVDDHLIKLDTVNEVPQVQGYLRINGQVFDSKEKNSPVSKRTARNKDSS